jgi:hypothetical protein
MNDFAKVIVELFYFTDPGLENVLRNLSMRGVKVSNWKIEEMTLGFASSTANLQRLHRSY